MLATYDCVPKLIYGDQLIPSREGPHQGDSLSSLEFCEAVQPILNDLSSDLQIGFIDDLSLSADLPTLAQDVSTIIKSESSTGLKLNSSKCEIIMEDYSQLEHLDVFKDFIRVPKENMTLLRVHIWQGTALDNALGTKVDDRERAISRLKLLRAHDALVLLKEQHHHPETTNPVPDIKFFQPSSTTQIWHGPQGRSLRYPQCGLQRNAVDAGHSSSKRWRIGKEVCKYTGNFSFFSIWCFNSRSPAIDFTFISQSASIPW